MVIKLYHNSRRMSNKLLGQKRVAIDLQKKIEEDERTEKKYKNKYAKFKKNSNF